MAAEVVLRAAGYAPEIHRRLMRVTNAADPQVRAGSIALDCYPSNSRAYFELDLRESAVVERY